MRNPHYSEWYKNKRVLVTGGTSGIGLEMVRLLAGWGAQVVFCGRDPQAVESVGRAFRAEGFCVDLSSRHDVIPFIKELRSRYHFDLLINNAGLGNMSDFVQADIAALETMMAVNIDAVVLLCHEFLADMVKRSSGGILNVGSIASFFPTPGSGVYGATKCFIAGFTEALHEELRFKGIHVTGVYPGKTFSRFLYRATDCKTADWDKAMKPEVVAEAGLAGLAFNKVRVIPGLYNKFIYLLVKFIPIGLLLRLTRQQAPQRLGTGGGS
ncbi:MAG: SDR family NAD(P)-dependent oxidoreductase [Candidatus Omnitrophica bacterium]|nr:SDR family NAD(P)-dependent oxidoreductase [Candidatus Omnitrophota bacterium]